jgi:hypothetical protein
MVSPKFQPYRDSIPDIHILKFGCCETMTMHVIHTERDAQQNLDCGERPADPVPESLTGNPLPSVEIFGKIFARGSFDPLPPPMKMTPKHFVHGRLPHSSQKEMTVKEGAS